MEIGKGNLDINQFNGIVSGNEKVQLSSEALKRVSDSFAFLQQFAKDKVIYGINTGFGPMAQYRIPDEKGRDLQLNLIRSHASGHGEPLKAADVRALMLCRLNTLMLGYSGVHPDVVHCLTSFLNEEVTPFIPEHGGVGASGDLVQLAHLAHTMIGEGKVVHNGRIIPVRELPGFERLKFTDIHIREGLAVMNGTAAMSGIGLHNITTATRLVRWSTQLSAIINELMESYDDHVSLELNQAKKHRGQQVVAAAMRALFSESKLIKLRTDKMYKGTNGEAVFKEKVQEYYSLRCVPQILGPVLDAVRHAERILLEEVNSANDNPIIDVASENVFHGGNFHGDYAAFEMDKLKIGITKLTMLAERQLNYLVNHKLNEKLPPFLNLGELGFNFGLQGMQFTAVSTTAENQTLSNPMYIHSIPNNNDNQDVVSMGANAALLAQRVITNAQRVLAIEAIAVCQAVDCLRCEDKLSGAGRELYNLVRAQIPAFIEDSPGTDWINAMIEIMNHHNPIELEK